jgi:hypothetical protein
LGFNEFKQTDRTMRSVVMIQVDGCERLAFLSTQRPDADFNHRGAEPTPDQWREHWQRCVDEAGNEDMKRASPP